MGEEEAWRRKEEEEEGWRKKKEKERKRENKVLI